MARLKTLKGSTLIEAVVSAVIFLIVFAASLDIVTRISTNRNDDDYIIVEVDNCVDIAMARYGSGYGVGTYEDTFSWGMITTLIEEYREYDSMLQVVVRADIEGSHRRITYRRLIEKLDTQ